MSGSVRLSVADSPAHFMRPGQYLKHLRDNKDLKSCGITFQLKDGTQDQLHSLVAFSHSDKLAQMLANTRFPTVLDLSSFPPAVVSNVVNWLYTGEIAFGADHLADYLSVAHTLGFNVLHHDLEKKLIEIAKFEDVVFALNIATSPAAGVSTSTLSAIVTELHDKYAKLELYQHTISRLSLKSIEHVVSTNVKKSYKIALLNIALFWLREPTNFHLFGDVIDRLTVDGLNSGDESKLKKILAQLLQTPATRRNVQVSLKEGHIYVSCSSPNTATTASLQSYTGSCATSEMFSVRDNKQNQAMLSPSDLKELEDLPADDIVFGNPKYNTVRPVADTCSGPRTEIVGLPSDTLVFGPEKNSCQWSRSFTPSEIQNIRNIPDVFNRNYVHPAPSKNQAGNRTDNFKGIGQLRFSQSEIEEIKHLPNLFVSQGGPQNSDSVSDESDVSVTGSEATSTENLSKCSGSSVRTGRQTSQGSSSQLSAADMKAMKNLMSQMPTRVDSHYFQDHDENLTKSCYYSV